MIRMGRVVFGTTDMSKLLIPVTRVDECTSRIGKFEVKRG
jgi:hypothetical protein